MNNILNTKLNLRTQFDAVVYFIEQLDIDMVDQILDNHNTYQDQIKEVFIKKLSNAFDKFILNGDTYLIRNSGYCDSSICDRFCTGFSFIGNNSKNYMNLIIINKNDRVFDIYECTVFNNYGEDFIRNQRIFL